MTFTGPQQPLRPSDVHLSNLSAELIKRDLKVRRRGDHTLRASNPKGEPDPHEPKGQHLSPGLNQEVVCRLHPDDTWWWYWIWHGPTGSPPDYERLCPAEDYERAAERIAHVLAVPTREPST